MNLSTPIEKIPGIGTVYQKRLKKLGIKTVGKLLFYFPRSYQDFSQITDIAKIKLNENVCIKGKILDIKSSKTWKKKIGLTSAIIEDKTGAIKVTWFNQPYLAKVLKKGEEIYLSGKVLLGKSGTYLSNPAYEKYSSIRKGKIIPVYPETKGLSSKWIRSILRPLLLGFKNKIPETLPEDIIKKQNLLPISKALWQIHFPDSLKLAQKAQTRFSFEELFFIQLFILEKRMKLNKEKSFTIPFDVSLVQNLVKKLPFKLTDAQRKAIWQILKDMEKPKPMNRLLEGDVGSGKTVVAIIAALLTIKAGYQVAFMAPTEILTKQHFQEANKILSAFNINIGLLTGKTDKWSSKKLKNDTIEISRAKLLEKTIKGEIDFLIGTHSLIQDKVKFNNLGLIILDEQHRFGIEQRAKLIQKPKPKSKIKIPHLLSMTATPIPRTLALTIYGDLDLSLIDELPKGRKKIITKVVGHNDRQKVYNFIKKQVKKGRQVFVICPRIEPKDNGQETIKINNEQRAKNNRNILSWAEVKTVKQEYQKLSEKIFPDLNIAMLHSKIALKEKERIMKNFKYGKIDILVSTSVIEVGIDIPNASVMLIEGADRFGLAQLHQFRGRVGRAKHQSFCFLFTDSQSKKTHQRLKALINCEDGFALAEKDLIIRGPGSFFGTKQWGIPDLAMKAISDISLVEKAREIAKEYLDFKKYPIVLERLKAFQEKVHLE